jgi:hypothetical protein
MNKDILSSYVLAFDEINALTSTSYKSAGGDVSRIADDILSFLINAYTLGIKAVSQMLAYEITVDVSKMNDAIYTVIDGKTFEDRIADHVNAGDLAGLQTLAESEFHRVYNTATDDGAKSFSSSVGYGVNKTWVTVGDDKVRDTHRYLEQISVGLDEEFYTYDGDHASYPGGFTKAENNVGCRCIVEYRMDAEQE